MRDRLKEDDEVLMSEGLVQFEAEVQSSNEIRSRIVWPDSEGPWVPGTLDDLMVHFAYASWTAFNLGFALSLSLVCTNERLCHSISDLMTKAIASIGAVQVAEMRLTPEALERMRRERIEP